ncbi:hypothetical protein HALDL1_06910 [Halobacterium sp. DL1]|jgi:hypothetical protein|nr:hypothetical protein HALDL1_06910 [Halobacterium sp. DL1]
MPSRRSLALCSVLVVALLAAVAPTTAAPPPEDVCGACGSQFESAVADAGGSVSVAESALDVQVFENGSARVVVTNRLAGSDGDWVADNSDAVVGALAGRGGGLAPVPADATIQVVDDRVTVTYRSNDVARTTVGGVVLVDAFRDTASSGWTVNADRFRLAAPPGHAVTAGPAATEDGVLTAERGASLPAAFVAFAPDDGAVSTVATQVALAIETGPRFLANAALVLAVPVLALAGLLRGVDALAARVGAPQDATSVGTAVALGSAALLVGLVLSGQATTYFMLHGATPLFAALTGLVVGGLAVTDRVHDWRAFAAAAVGTPLLLGVVGAVVGANAHPEVALPTVGRALAAGLLAAQLWTFAVVGALDAAVSDWVRLAAVVAPLVGVVALLGPGILLAPVVLLWLVVLALFGLPAYLVGAALATRT